MRRFWGRWPACVLAAWLLPALAGLAFAGAPAEADPLGALRFESVGVGAIPRDAVVTTAQDRAGFLWLATGDGLMRFDGYRLRLVEREHADPARRGLGWVQALLPARDGRLWIGTESQGVAVYDPAEDRVQMVTHPDPGILPYVRALAEEADGTVWAGFQGRGLERFDAARQAFVRWAPAAAGADPLLHHVQALWAGRDGTLWVGSAGGLARRRAGAELLEAVALPGAVHPDVQALVEAADGRLWVGTSQGDLFTVQAQTGMATLVARPPGPVGAVTAFVEAPDDRIWVGRRTGLELRDARDGRLLQQLRHDPARRASLAANEVTTLLRDRAGAVWVGGLGLGLQRHETADRGLRMRGADTAPRAPFAEPSARSLLVRPDGQVWAAVRGAGVVLFDAQLRTLGTLRPPPATAAAPAEDVHAMAQSGDGSAWLAGGSQIVQVGAGGGVLRRLPGVGFVNSLSVDRAGVLWICAERGLHRVDRDAAGPVPVTLADGRLPGGAAYVAAQAADGDLWVGTGVGLYRVPSGARTLEAVPATAGARLANEVVIGLLFDRRGRLWLDTAVSGLHRLRQWDGHAAAFDRVSMRHGVVGRPFGSNLLEDAQGRIWTHLYVYDPARDRLDELTAADGKDLGLGWFLSYATLPDGRFLFGGSKGLLVVQPERFAASDLRPPLVASELRINGVPVPVDPGVAELTLQPQQRSFSLEFAALDYSDPQRLRYAYRLVGFDPDWVHTGAERRAASYSNLDPGRYELRVRATNRSGIWNPEELSIAINVEPAWWQGLPARLVLVLLLLAAVAAFVQWRTGHLRRRGLALQAKVRERTAELERLAAELRESSLTDPLTGLRNRRYLAAQIGDDVALSLRRRQASLLAGEPPPADADLVFFVIDIDHFKRVNDDWGHAAGDAVLQQLPARLAAVFRETDHQVRWGGEEFLVVARATAREHAPELAARACRAVAAAAFDLGGGRQLHCTVSVGFACLPLDGAAPLALDWQDTVALADVLLYRVKASGRDGWAGALGAGEIDAHTLATLRPLTRWAEQGLLERLQLRHAAPLRGL